MRLAIKFSLMSLAIFAGAAAPAATSARAASTANPRWARCVAQASGKFEDSSCTKEGASKLFEAKFLAAEESLELEAEASGRQVLKANVLGTLECNKAKLSKGSAVLGSKAPGPGTALTAVQFSGCTTGQPECDINGEAAGKASVMTASLKETLVYKTKAAAEKEEAAPTADLVEPSKGKVLLEFELSGTCKTAGVFQFEGGFVFAVLKAAEHRELQEVEAPGVSSSTFFVNTSGKTEERKAELKTTAGTALYQGKLIRRLVSHLPWWIGE